MPCYPTVCYVVQMRIDAVPYKITQCNTAQTSVTSSNFMRHGTLQYDEITVCTSIVLVPPNFLRLLSA
eukprot:scaffold161264_cov13-Prasinocladus_malaysianus.AAC.1